MSNFNKASISLIGTNCDVNPHLLYKNNVSMVLTLQNMNTGANLLHTTPDEVMELLKTNGKNLIVLEVNYAIHSWGYYETFSEVSSMEHFNKLYNDIIEILANNPNIKHLIFNAFALEAYGIDASNAINVARNKLTIKNLANNFGDIFNNLKSLTINVDPIKQCGYGLWGTLPTKLLNGIEDVDFSKSKLEFLSVNGGMKCKDYSDYTCGCKKDYLNAYKYLCDKLKYIDLFGSFRNGIYNNNLWKHRFDYYRYQKDGVGFDSLDEKSDEWANAEKDIILSNNITNPAKPATIEQYLYYKYRGNLLNGYKYKKFKYPRPDDIWDSKLPVGAYHEN